MDDHSPLIPWFDDGTMVLNGVKNAVKNGEVSIGSWYSTKSSISKDGIFRVFFPIVGVFPMGFSMKKHIKEKKSPAGQLDSSNWALHSL